MKKRVSERSQNVQLLTRLGLPGADIGRLMGVTRQWVSSMQKNMDAVPALAATLSGMNLALDEAAKRLDELAAYAAAVDKEWQVAQAEGWDGGTLAPMIDGLEKARTAMNAFRVQVAQAEQAETDQWEAEQAAARAEAQQRRNEAARKKREAEREQKKGEDVA